MAKPASRQEFKEYILRKNGAPVIQINLSDEQIEDRIDEAIQFWNDYHYSGSEHVYLKHQLTQADIDNGYLDLPSEIYQRLLGVTRIFNFGTSLSSGTGMFNVSYQFVLNNIQDITSYNVSNYYQTMQHLQFIQEILVGMPMIRFNKHVNKIQLDMTMSRLVPGTFIIIEGYDIIDEALYSDMWNDRWLQNYAAALVREQWGVVLTKFTNMQLVGGVQFNGEQILSEAREERRAMEEQAISSLQPMIYNFSG
jgi:hypothetical protein